MDSSPLWRFSYTDWGRTGSGTLKDRRGGNGRAAQGGKIPTVVLVFRIPLLLSGALKIGRKKMLTKKLLKITFMKSSLFVTEIQLLSFSPLVVIITNHWIYAWNRFSIANKMMINWVPGLLSWIEFFVLSSSHGKSVHTLECIRKGCKSWFRLIIDEVKALCALFWFWQHWLCQKLLMVTIMLKI